MENQKIIKTKSWNEFLDEYEKLVVETPKEEGKEIKIIIE